MPKIRTIGFLNRRSKSQAPPKRKSNKLSTKVSPSKVKEAGEVAQKIAVKAMNEAWDGLKKAGERLLFPSM
jgi:hypothetical protein